MAKSTTLSKSGDINKNANITKYQVVEKTIVGNFITQDENMIIRASWYCLISIKDTHSLEIDSRSIP